jgi:hypothetical protein
MNHPNTNPLLASLGNMNRRRFLAVTAMASTITILPRHVLGGPGQSPPSEKVNIAGIGVGGMGAANLQALASQNIVALCGHGRRSPPAFGDRHYPFSRA